MPFRIEKGDLFSFAEDPLFKNYALAHCISIDCRMGKGIAVQFRNRFGGIEDLKRQAERGVGSVGHLVRCGRTVYYMFTKRAYYQKPTWSDFSRAVKALKQLAEEHQVQGILLPKIGCGLDQLDWNHVSALLNESFSSSPIDVLVCLL